MTASVNSFWWRFRHSWALRIVVLALRRDPMCRRSDRVEAVAVMAAAVLSLLAIPLAVVAGMYAFSASMVAVHRESSDRQRVVATVVATVPEQSLRTTGVASQATVAWRAPSGRRLTADIPVVGVPKTGSHLDVWIDRAGHRVAAPLTRSQAQVQSDAIGIAVGLAVPTLAYLLLLSVRALLVRGRARAWDAEWIEVGSEPRS